MRAAKPGPPETDRRTDFNQEITMTGQPTALPEDDEPTTLRRIVTADEYDTAYSRAAAAAQAVGVTVPHPALHDAVRGVLAAVGLLTPPPEPDTTDGTCTAQFADDEGQWWQCEMEPHDPSEGHDGGDWGWGDDAPNAVPASRQ
ncbi:hypothetical protein ACIQU6_30580 [Streptomyces sp. NPDC090442]|uniref:hypothetical protein n=1 Tax=Streptomyces sp. NPDC090442 TaxID=3365962 RepID=UPI003806618C